MNVKHLCACTYTDAGFRLKNVALIERAVRIWRDLGPHTSPSILYNLASAQLYLWQLAVEQKGLGDAWLNKRSHLHEARRLFILVAQDKDADTELRLKALTDCGNSFDIVGRYLDALDCYERALKLDSSFGMVAGNRGITLLNVAPLMGATNPTCCYKPPLTWIPPSATKIVYCSAVDNQRSTHLSDGVLHCRSRGTYITVPLSLPLSLATRISTGAYAINSSYTFRWIASGQGPKP